MSLLSLLPFLIFCVGILRSCCYSCMVKKVLLPAESKLSADVSLNGDKWLVKDAHALLESAVADHRPQGVDDDAQGHEGGNVSMIVRRAHFDNLHATQALFRHKANQFEGFARQETTRLGPTSARHKGRFDGINIVAHVDGVTTIPGPFEGHLGDLVYPMLFNIVHGKDIRLALDHVGNSRARYLKHCVAVQDGQKDKNNWHEKLQCNEVQVAKYKYRT